MESRLGESWKRNHDEEFELARGQIIDTPGNLTHNRSNLSPELKMHHV